MLRLPKPAKLLEVRRNLTGLLIDPLLP